MFDQVLEDLECELGLVVPDPTRAILARKLPNANREELLAYLTNGQTYFFRHPDQCKAFEDYLRDLSATSSLRLWSAGCSTGCEAYSIAIMLERTRRMGRVLGTDISAARIAEAREGVYRESRLERLTPEERQRYFWPLENQWKVQAHLASLVSFELENLNLDHGPGMARRWDVIFCRNVLIYFDEAKAREILVRLVERLEVGGLLVLGFPEAFFGLQHPELRMWSARSAIFVKELRPALVSAPKLLPGPVGVSPLALAPGPFQEGLRLHAMGKLEEAGRKFQEAEESDPHSSLVFYFSARLHDELQQPTEAVSALRKFFALYREDDPKILAFTERNGLSVDQLSSAASRLRERLERGRA